MIVYLSPVLAPHLSLNATLVALRDRMSGLDQPRSQGLFLPYPKAREKALGTRLGLDLDGV